MNTRSYIPILVLVAFTGAGSLIKAWRDSPYAQLGWLAFLIWIAPCVYRRTISQSSPRWAYYVSGSLAVAGFVIDVHVINHAALALAVIGFCPSNRRNWLWILAAVSWIPATGYGVAQLGIDPQTVCSCAILIAALPSIAAWLQPAASVFAETEEKRV